MSQILNISKPLHDRISINIPYSNITAIRCIQVLHKCSETHGHVVKINCSLVENEENYGLIGHIFTDSKLDINDDPIYINEYTDNITLYLTDLNDDPIVLDENIYVSLCLEIE